MGFGESPEPRSAMRLSLPTLAHCSQSSGCRRSCRHSPSTNLTAAAKSLQSCPTLCDPWTVPARLLCPWDCPGKNPGVGYRFLLQGVLSTRGSNLGLVRLLTAGRFLITWVPEVPSLVAQTVKHLSTMRETWVQSLGQEDPLEKEMATHSSDLAWKIPWTEEPGGLQSMGLQRVRHD